mmetsp:Transcript_3465/g.5015  ORF Transcript_3465/g.5015 Transcript_3465/m.5015 type:complete len:186 (-) Transcript_3465:77-634(-)
MNCVLMHAQCETRRYYNRIAGLDMQLDLNTQDELGSASSTETTDTTSQNRRSLPGLRLVSSAVFKESRGSRSSRQARSSREEEGTKPHKGRRRSSSELGIAMRRTSSSSSMITRTQSASSEMGISFYQLALARTPSAAEPVTDTPINLRRSGPIAPYTYTASETQRPTRNIGSLEGFDTQTPLKA